MWFFLGLISYLAAAVLLVSAGLIGLSVLLTPPESRQLASQPAATTGAGTTTGAAVKSEAEPGERNLVDAPPTDTDFRHGPKIDHAAGRAPVNHSRQALDDARGAMAQERTATPRGKRSTARQQREAILASERPPESVGMTFEYPPERPSGH